MTGGFRFEWRNGFAWVARRLVWRRFRSRLLEAGYGSFGMARFLAMLRPVQAVGPSVKFSDNFQPAPLRTAIVIRPNLRLGKFRTRVFQAFLSATFQAQQTQNG